VSGEQLVSGSPAPPPKLSPRLLGLAMGFLLDRRLGDPARRHPVAGFGVLAKALERVMWAPSRTTGTAYTALAVAAPSVVVAVIDRMLRRQPAGRTALMAGLTWGALGGRSLERAAHAVGELLVAGDLAGARERLPTLVGRDPTGLGEAELCRAVIESVAENTPDAVVGALLWGTLAGPAGVVAYRAANTLDAMVGHHSPRYERFGWASARLDDVLTWPAARLCALLAVALSPLVGGRPGATWRVLRRDGRAHPSPNAGRMEAAFAGALGITLGGTNRYPSHVEHRPHLGDGLAPVPGDLRRAVTLSRAVSWAAATLAVAYTLALTGPAARRR